MAVTFADIAIEPNSGIDEYRRAESPDRDALFDVLRQQPTYTFDDLPATPLKSRGAPGVALFDYDGDGDEDIYVTNGPGAANSLYQNQLVETGETRFVDVATAAGVAAISQDSSGVSYGDIDNDGDLDLLVLGVGTPNRLFENQGNGTFVDITEASNIGGDETFSTSASFGDVNGDGLIDIAISNTFNLDNQVPIFAEPFALNEPNQLLINQGDNTFVDASESSGLTNISSLSPGAATISWAIAMVDYDLDGDLDIIHADDQAAILPTELGGVDRGYIQIFNNDGTGQFTNVTAALNLDVAGAWMGLSFGDFNGDGRLDLFASNFGNFGGSILGGEVANVDFASRWYLQQEDGTFLDPGLGAVGETPFGWGTSTLDYDNDGDTDILFHGGLDVGPYVDATNPGALLANDGAANFSYDTAALANSTDHQRRNVQGVAVGDLNSDGFVDIVSVSNFDTPEPLPVLPIPTTFGSAFDGVAGFVPTFTPTENPGEFVPSGFELPDGTLSVELSSADNGNNWVEVSALGTVGLTAAGRVNRDGIGAVFSFTPEGGQVALQPILGGSSYASQDSLAANFGLGTAEAGTIEVLWPGGTRNRLYDVAAGSRITFPEIPVSFDDPTISAEDYAEIVAGSLEDLVDRGLLDANLATDLEASAIRAFRETRGITDDGGRVIRGTAGDDAIAITAGNRRVVFAGRGDDLVTVATRRNNIFGGSGDDTFLAAASEGRNRFSGGKGDDLFVLGAGGDRFLGGAGDDRFEAGAGSGNNRLRGGAGADIFALVSGPQELPFAANTIVDFTAGEDFLSVPGLGFADLEFADNDILIDGAVVATLTGVDTAMLTLGDFV